MAYLCHHRIFFWEEPQFTQRWKLAHGSWVASTNLCFLKLYTLQRSASVWWYSFGGCFRVNFMWCSNALKMCTDICLFINVTYFTKVYWTKKGIQEYCWSMYWSKFYEHFSNVNMLSSSSKFRKTNPVFCIFFFWNLTTESLCSKKPFCTISFLIQV